ncbi:H+/nucleoside cotransporter [Zopfochytrium polystomum]|nr:H+/nucleoside cotransporter [Zopfochytrium polystomum]
MTDEKKIDEVVNVEVAAPVDDIPAKLVDGDDAAAKDKPAFGKRSTQSALIYLAVWIVLTVYFVLLLVKGKGKNGYEFAIVMYCLITLRMLAKHVSPSKVIYAPLGKVWDSTFGAVSGKMSELVQNLIVGAVVAACFIITIVASPTSEKGNIGQRFQSFAGLIIMLGLLYLTSADRAAIKWRTVTVGLLFQFIIAIFVLRTQVGVNIFKFISQMVTGFLGFSRFGLEFLFGSNSNNPFQFTFAVSVLPAIVFFCSIISIVYYIGAMQYVIGKFAWLMVRVMDTSGAESVVAAASPFVGQGESALLVRPFVEYMTLAELHSTMTSGFATIAGSVLLAYVNYTGNSPEATSALLTACVMSVPCSLLVSKLRMPEKEASLTKGKVTIPENEEKDANLLHAAGNGAATGIQLILLISGALLSIVALYALADYVVGWVFDMIDVHNWLSGEWISIAFILSYVFYPISLCIGISPYDSRKSAEFMATKMVANEFVAYSDLYSYAYSNVSGPDGTFPSNGNLQPRTLRLLAFALCGFANFSSIGIQIGTLGTMAPSRKGDLAALALSAMITGTFSTWITAAVAGCLL